MGADYDVIRDHIARTVGGFNDSTPESAALAVSSCRTDQRNCAGRSKPPTARPTSGVHRRRPSPATNPSVSASNPRFHRHHRDERSRRPRVRQHLPVQCIYGFDPATNTLSRPTHSNTASEVPPLSSKGPDRSTSPDTARPQATRSEGIQSGTTRESCPVTAAPRHAGLRRRACSGRRVASRLPRSG